MKKDKKKRPKDKPVSLAPLEFEEAVSDLLKVKPKKDDEKLAPKENG